MFFKIEENIIFLIACLSWFNVAIPCCYLVLYQHELFPTFCVYVCVDGCLSRNSICLTPW